MDEFEEKSVEAIPPKKTKQPEPEKRLFLQLLVPMKVVVKGIGTILADGTVLNNEGDVITGQRSMLGPVSSEIANAFRGAARWKVIEK